MGKMQLFILRNGKTKQWGLTRLCHDFDWRLDLYFWSWTAWIEEVEDEGDNG